ncbi:hypothetical protein TRIATDRAFT_89278 [Trichoderma atroviride IMI 206040]|uniref:Fumarylacetoacetate hydrolase n=1 Tax=Hypocrea atroviridis (strain ATCC 20476 / IMI 206040) TaxID=452589 RepID=G9PAT9_HYPAI|nr:uncharacterized protein TRIATDRAFT_89278 [Trichoderma atroviride IMI 206040]EHK40121.1 hypothetical protein TRIATDRAFT_89278 [Trichoderma atroviride IMI 206040]
MSSSRLSNYAAFTRPDTGISQIGHLDVEQGTIQPLSLLSGYPLQDLYQVIEAGPLQITASGSALPLSSVKLLAPISGRDVLAVGKNYMEHAKEFNASGYDSSDKVDRPSHPVIFTKRATSIIADGEDIFLHPEFSKSVDYEGEIGVIVGKAGFRIPKERAMEYVWGYTIINDMTARERQRDHKQFYIGKSADTFCPMGPAAVPKEHLPLVLRVQTHVNGELRQDATTDDLIFDIPTLISTLSEGQTLLPGDVIATGTPAGVGIGRNPPIFLKDGDEIAVTIPGIGTLHNKVTSYNATTERLASQSVFSLSNATRSVGATAGLTNINGKLLHYKHLGSGDNSIVFVHGLGGTCEYFSPLISEMGLQDVASLHLFDFEGQGLSPTHPLSVLTVDSLAADVAGVFSHAGITESNPGTLIAQAMGCIVALKFALNNPGLVKKLVLFGPPSFPLSEAARRTLQERGELIRTSGMGAVVDTIVQSSTSEHTKTTNPLAISAIRLSLLGQEPEAFAKALQAFARDEAPLPVEHLDVQAMIVTGSEDKVASAEEYASKIKGAETAVLPNVAQWHVYADVKGVSDSLKSFL